MKIDFQNRKWTAKVDRKDKNDSKMINHIYYLDLTFHTLLRQAASNCSSKN